MYERDRIMLELSKSEDLWSFFSFIYHTFIKTIISVKKKLVEELDPLHPIWALDRYCYTIYLSIDKKNFVKEGIKSLDLIPNSFIIYVCT